MRRVKEFFLSHFDVSLSKPTPEGEAVDRRELNVSQWVPYTKHYDDETLMTVNNALLHVIKIDGLCFDSLSPAKIKQFENQRNTILRSIANNDRAVYVHLIRRKYRRHPKGEFRNWFAKYFDEQWRSVLDKNELFVNEIYVTIVRNRFRRGPAGWFDRVAGALAGSKADQARVETFEEQARDLYQASNLVIKGLAEYGARRLKIQRGDEDSPDRAEISTFLYYLLNLEDVERAVGDETVAENIIASRVNFGRGCLEIDGVGNHRVGAILSMKQWPARTPSRMLDNFLKMPVEMVITQSFFFVDQITSSSEMTQQKDRMAQVRDADEEDMAGISQSIKDVNAGRTVNGKHHLTMLVHVGYRQDDQTTLRALDDALDVVKKGFIGLNVTPVREMFAVETFFWSQLPGQKESLIGRRGQISSKNFAGFASLHNYATGKYEGNLWGNCVMAFPTESRTFYYFNFHREIEGMVPGHTKCAAETGAGKTALISAIVAQADKVEPMVVWFDRNHGAETFMRAMRAEHCVLSTQRPTGWNPFQLPDTPENRKHLVELQRHMRRCLDTSESARAGVVSPDDITAFERVVDENYQLANVSERRLRNLAWLYGDESKPLGKAMSLWYGRGPYAGVFDNPAHNIDYSKARHYCYEMKELMTNNLPSPELPVMLTHLLHCVRQSMDGKKPVIIVLDEGQNLVIDPFWRAQLDALLGQIRRLNGLIVFMTPDPKYLYAYTDAIKKQCATSLYLPSSNADHTDYVTNLDLVEREFEFIRDTLPSDRKFLIRRGQESIRAIFDLSDIPHVIPVLSSTPTGVALMHEVMQEVGSEEPQAWVPIFMERAMARNTHNLSTPARR